MGNCNKTLSGSTIGLDLGDKVELPRFRGRLRVEDRGLHSSRHGGPLIDTQRNWKAACGWLIGAYS